MMEELPGYWSLTVEGTKEKGGRNTEVTLVQLTTK